MADFIISPYAISFNSIKNALQNYIQNKSDVTKTWKDFYTASAGETILELDAAVAAFYAFHFIIGRRESYLTVAQNYNSVVGGALDKGYNCSRGHNVFLALSIIPEKTQTLSKWTIIGSYAEYDVILLEDVILNAGQPAILKCVIGNLSSQAVVISSTNLQQFVFTAPNVTDTCHLILTNREVPFATELKEAVNDKYIMLTNSFGAVDVFYLNNGKYKYTPADTLYLQYVERNNLTFGGLSASNLTIIPAKQIDKMELLEDAVAPEDKEHIRIAAPIHHETDNVVRARKDYVKFLKQNNPLIIDANDKDINPGLIALTYLKKQESVSGTSLLTPKEKEDYVKLMTTICPDGVAKAFIEDPIRVVRSLAIKIWQKAQENIPATIEEDIDKVLDAYRNKLAPVLDLEQIEHNIENLPGVKIARVDLGSKEYQKNTQYKLYDVVTVPKILVGTTYQTWTLYCAKVQSQTGDTEPDWAAAPSVGDQIQDNNFIWENSNKYTNSVSGVWQKNGEYALYSDINTSYTVAPFCTLATEPYWGNAQQKDGNVTWNMLKSYDHKLSEHENGTKYQAKQSLILKNKEKQAIYTVQKVFHKSGKEQPDWGKAKEINDLVMDNALTWTLKYKGWKPETNFLQSDEIGVVMDNKLYIYAATAGTTGSENPFKKVEQTIEDNTITWNLVEQKEIYTTWKPQTEIIKGSFINGFDRFFELTDNENTISGKNTQFYKDKWLPEVTDNNLLLTLDKYTIEDQNFDCQGITWKPKSPFNVGDQIIASSALGTFLYRVNYSSEVEQTMSNVIYSVVNYAGRTGKEEPKWSYTITKDGQPQTVAYDNVVDNDILWTKTENVSDVAWQPNTTKHHGNIIKTPVGNYVFASILGKSGDTAPDWTGIKNNQIKDNNITWVRITNSNTMALQWNEYLDLKAENPTIVG